LPNPSRNEPSSLPQEQEAREEPATPAPVVVPPQPEGDPLQEKIDQIMKESDEAELIETEPSPSKQEETFR
jgi:hypothetical protein